MPRHRHAVWLLMMAPLLAAPSSALSQIGHGDDPGPAVFQLISVKHEGSIYRQAEYGTGFFIAADGTALTVSHVVYQAQHDPEQYRLLAIVDKAFYSADIVCASKLQQDPTKPAPGGVTFGRDVAEIRVMPSTFPFLNWVHTFPTGERLTLATAHRGPLPQFPYLVIRSRPGVGDPIHVVGFGHISPMAEQWTASGQITRLSRTPDGTEIFEAQFTGRPQPGNSGSPVLNDRNEVIGLWPWSSLTQSNMGTAISNTALETPCP